MANPNEGRRGSVRAATKIQIKHAARKRLTRHGADGVQIRAVARDVGLVPSALYRYYPSRKALLTELAVDAAASMAQSMAQARDAAPVDNYGSRWRALCNAYRDWAVAHPEEYALVFSLDWSQDAQTSARMLLAIPSDEYAQALEDGAAEKSESSEGSQSDLLDALLLDQPSLTRTDAAALVNAWASVHGFVSLDTHKSVFSAGPPSATIFDRHISNVMDGLGYR